MSLNKEITLKDRSIPYTLRINRRSRSVRLCLRPNGDISVTVPGSAYFSQAEKFLIEKSEWIIGKMKLLEEKKKSFLFPYGATSEYKKHKKAAAKVIEDRVKKINGYYGFSYGRISVRNQKTRWGSCSTKGNLSYNYKIAFLPDKHADYVIAHELCHLKEFNHSSSFWALVEKTVPDYKAIRREMKAL